MALHINDGWKVLITTLGLSLVGCGGEGLEGQGSLARNAQRLDGAVTVTLNGDAEMTLECNVNTWSDPGATATDGDGNPLEVVTYNSGHDAYGPGPQASAVGIYSVQYAAYDASWNTASAVRTVNVVDTRAPTLTLKDGEVINHQCGSNFDYTQHISATDECYGDQVAAVTWVGDVNGWAEGTYTVEYSLSDGSGNAAPSATLTVNVVDCPW
ncbi:MAG: immunoglobulin-like domain-containing protein [Hyalangium sp.]|uniref:immunoglobulin-like domain-containing protein n=1 Tax=Hyalangium sp. TaxID=2028555 RepID=UPI00389A6BED